MVKIIYSDWSKDDGIHPRYSADLQYICGKNKLSIFLTRPATTRDTLQIEMGEKDAMKMARGILKSFGGGK